MKTKVFVYLFMLTLLTNCGVNHSKPVSKGSKTDMLQNAIMDFEKSSKKNKSKVFHINFYNYSNSVKGVSISPVSKNKYSLNLNDTIGNLSNHFPSKFILNNERLYLWNDSLNPLKKELITIMSNYKVLDSSRLNGKLRPLFILEENKRSMKYLFCKNNLKTYKRYWNTSTLEYLRKDIITSFENQCF